MAWIKTLPRSWTGTPLVHRDDPRRQRVAEPKAVGERTQSMESHVADDLVAAGFHLDLGGAGAVHFGSALLVGVLGLLTTPVSLTRGHFCSSRSSSVHVAA